MARIAVGLVHWPIVDKIGDVVCTNVTNLDIHDIARACRVFQVERYYIINRQQAQLAFVHRILDHWRVGEGAYYNQKRKTSLTMVHTAQTIEEAIQDWGVDPFTVATSAQSKLGRPEISFSELRTRAQQSDTPIFLFFGTGYGLAPALDQSFHAWLEPIRGVGDEDYRHLSVRSAASICLDRLFRP